MKYKLVLTGKNEAIIDDFFKQMSDSFEVVTTSTRYSDLTRHLSFFQPDFFVYCLYNETRDDLIQIANLKSRMSNNKVPLVIIGAKDDCDEFIRVAANAPDLVLHRPLSVGTIQTKITALAKDMNFRKAMNEKNEEQAVAGSSGSPRRAPEGGASIEFDRDSINKLMDQLASPDGGTEPLPDIPVRRNGRMHILVVDDNPMMLKMLKEHLHDQYDVATAASGRVALKFLERKKTDLILLDYEMPEESGPDVLEKLRPSDFTKDIPVIFLTGVTDAKKIKEALSLGPQNYLLKPVDREKLLETIAKTIG